jgi:hypothetical protein
MEYGAQLHITRLYAQYRSKTYKELKILTKNKYLPLIYLRKR